MEGLLRIGCLGAATITPAAIVHPSRCCSGVTLQAVAARDPARAEDFARAHGFQRFEASYAELIAAPDIDLIYNALPIDAHAPWSLKALAAGKHVLCEKPFAMNAGEAAAVLDAAARAGRRVIEALHPLYHPGFAQLLAWVDAIAPIHAIEAKFHLPIPDRNGAEIRHLPERGGGAFMDLGCYPLAWTLALMDAEPDAITAEAQKTARGVDESISAVLHFGEAKASLSASMAPNIPVEASLEVVGLNGRITYVNPVAPHLGAHLRLNQADQVQIVHPSRVTTYTYQLGAVVTALRNGSSLPAEGSKTLRQQRVLDAIYHAAGLGRLRHP